ncbi:hypothetical protein N7481_010525 [Penicillium waksmanii]|uniref:uncharacterized protein n=1 Tax=Penicillium waksmanii TaxID=69791 RepID=UPI002548573C|nr:uncharacterized protein N7481_010525 [Penicillium waksmanii]KAJ5973315.1 hypothetical protein N7481_010525 [Penicillium waksmanii]
MSSVSPSFFGAVNYTLPDAIFELTKTYNADPVAHKVNLGQGTYKDGNGILGFCPLASIISDTGYGLDLWQKFCCSPGRSSALHIVGTMLKEALGRDTTVYITKPSWSNHRKVFESIGFSVREFNYSSSAGVDMQSLIQTLDEAAPKSIFVFHASAHNPSGWDCRADQWKQIGAIVKERQLFPLFDAAYLGLTSGDYDHDAMGLYGMNMIMVLFFVRHVLTRVEFSSLARMIRVEISNPPAFGARVVVAILEDEELYAQWRKDLVMMSSRIAEMGRELYQGLTELGTPGDWKRIIEQKGMFCILGLTPNHVQHLQKEYHIYMAESSRVSIAGINGSNVRYVAECINETLKR